MTGGAFCVVCAGVLCLGVGSPASAEPITITSGSIALAALNQAGPISIVGTRGFSFEGGVIDTLSLLRRIARR
jgi:hypothetical protein